VELVARDPVGNKIFIKTLEDEKGYSVEISLGRGEQFAPCDFVFHSRAGVERAVREASLFSVDSSEFCKCLMEYAGFEDDEG
jgi:hypothetical protein